MKLFTDVNIQRLVLTKAPAAFVRAITARIERGSSQSKDAGPGPHRRTQHSEGTVLGAQHSRRRRHSDETTVVVVVVVVVIVVVVVVIIIIIITIIISSSSSSNIIITIMIIIIDTVIVISVIVVVFGVRYDVVS